MFLAFIFLPPVKKGAVAPFLTAAKFPSERKKSFYSCHTYVFIVWYSYIANIGCVAKFAFVFIIYFISFNAERALTGALFACTCPQLLFLLSKRGGIFGYLRQNAYFFL